MFLDTPMNALTIVAESGSVGSPAGIAWRTPALGHGLAKRPPLTLGGGAGAGAGVELSTVTVRVTVVALPRVSTAVTARTCAPAAAVVVSHDVA